MCVLKGKRDEGVGDLRIPYMRHHITLPHVDTMWFAKR